MDNIKPDSIPRAHKPSCSLWDFIGKKGNKTHSVLSRQVEITDLTEKIDGVVRKMEFLEMMGFMMNVDTDSEFKTCETSLLKLIDQRKELSKRPVSVGCSLWY